MPTLPLRVETDVQTKLVDTVNDDLGGHAFKAANRFKRGILDLSIQIPGLLHCYLEIKYVRGGFTRAGTVQFDLTRHQRQFIVDHVAAGGCAGWCMVVAMGNDKYALDCSRYTPPRGDLIFGSHWLIKKRGQRWPILEVVGKLQP